MPSYSTPPGHPEGIADDLALIGRNADTRERLMERGVEVVRSRTLELETARVAEFIRVQSGV